VRCPLALATLAALLAACGEYTDDPYLLDLQQRCRRLVPEVEKETGHRLGNVRVVVRSREAIAELQAPWQRKVLARIENGPRGAEVDEELRPGTLGPVPEVAAFVDRQGRIVFPDPGDPPGGPSMIVVESHLKPKAQDPRERDRILIHELVHVHQLRHLEAPAFWESIRSRADLTARSAVLEGHAQYLTQRIARRVGLGAQYDEEVRAYTEGPEAPQEWVRRLNRVYRAHGYFRYVQGREFVAYVVDRLGYAEAVKRIFSQPPTLAQVSRPEEYFAPVHEASWGRVFEDLRRWLARERGEANASVVALPTVRAMAGEAAAGFRAGFQLRTQHDEVMLTVLVAESGDAAARLHAAWTGELERLDALQAADGWHVGGSLQRVPGAFLMQYVWPIVGHVRRYVVHEGRLVVDVEVRHDSALEQGAERLARRALKFLTDAAWRAAWLAGDEALLRNDDPDLRLAAVLRRGSFVPDPDWEVRWAGRWCEARDEQRSEDERTSTLLAAIGDEHPAVVRRGLRAARVWQIPWPLLRPQLCHSEAAVRRAAWALMEWIDCDEDPAPGKAPAREVLPLADRALHDPDAIVREEAVECLHEFAKEGEVTPLFRRALGDVNRRVRFRAICALAGWHLATPELLPELLAQLDENSAVAAKALGQLGPGAETALPRLRALLDEPEPRAEAALAIWQISGDLAPLSAVVRESIHGDAPDGLEELGTVGAAAQPLVSDLAPLLDDERRWVRYATAEALGKIGGDEARRALTHRLASESDPQLKDQLRVALKELDG